MTTDHPGARENRLAREVSPYLLLHKSNPVDWYPWGEEALERARIEDKPIFLSVGYSTCYWCHVMERESFSDPQIAELMNHHFVNIKLDREERPELDEIYMAATQLLTQQGGWPNSVFLTPLLVPYFAGTYFPPEDRQGLPGFATVLQSMAEAWKSRRDDVQAQARELESAMRRFLEERGVPAAAVPASSVAERSLEALSGRFDAAWGGFGGAPKFPSPGNLFLLEELAGERPEAARMLEATLDHMARGGLYDQLAGGFHRYATDGEWKIPHFEKMLYDNGLLLELYAREHGRTGDPESARIVRETYRFLESEMSAPEGGFWSAIDAETHGHEGAYYVWTLDELEAVLGAEDAGFLATLYGFDRAPFFEGTSYVLHLPAPLAEQAQRRRTSRDELLAEIAPLKARLLAARGERERPATDDKVLADWNGMTISGLAVAGRILGDASMVERAARAADFLWDEMRPRVSPEGSKQDKRVLHHSWRGGRAKHAAFISDYVFYVRGLLALHEASGEERWLERAKALTGEQVERLADPRGGFCVAGARADILFRSREVFDGALPSANAIAVLNLLELARHSGEGRWLEIAEATLKAFGSIIEQQPEGARMLTLAARRYQAAVGEDVRSEASPPPSPGPLEEEARKVISARLEMAEAGEDGWRPFQLEIAITEGWHVYAHDADGETALPTELSARNAELRGVSYPPGDEGDGIRIYAGDVGIRGEVRAAEGAEERLVLKCQPCDAKRCLPEVEIEVAVK